MRNWHHTIIKLDQARNFITVHNQTLDPSKKINILGNSKIHVGIIESNYLIEFKPVLDGNTTGSLNLTQYKATHYCFEDIEGTRKVFFRKQDEHNKSTYTENVLINRVKDFLENHTTSTAGIVAANQNNNVKIEGICPNTRIINSQSFVDVLIMTLVNTKTSKNVKSYHYYSKIKQKILDNEIPLTSQYENSTGILKDYSEKYASIINISAPETLTSTDEEYNSKTAEEFTEFHRAGTDFVLSELLAYGRTGRGCLVVNSAGNFSKGNLDSMEIDEKSRALAFSKKTLVVSASKIDSSRLILDINNGINPDSSTYVFSENRAEYSGHGPRVDLCAPSSAIANPTSNDFSIHAPSMMMGGNIDNDEDYVNLSFISKNSTDTVITVTKNNVLLPGQCIEFGTKNSFFYDIRFINEISHEANSSIITLNSALSYTKNISLSNKVRVLVYKKKVSRSNDANSIQKIIVDDTKGLQKNQNVYIYDPSNMANGIITKIVLINSSENKVDLQNSLASLPLNKNLVLVPGQMIVEINRTGEKKYSTSSEGSRGYFQGQMVNFFSDNIESAYTNLTRKSGTYIYTKFIDDSSPTASIKSLSYGDYYSKFGGTSAAAPIISGVAALVQTANPQLNAVEIKHILKSTADKITGSGNYFLQTDIAKNNYQYHVHEATIDGKKYNFFGTGRVNAEAAVQMAINWSSAQKPRMEFPNKQNPSVPDIWVSEQEGTMPTGTYPYNKLVTTKDQKIYVRIKNTGTRHSFQETDLRVLVAFTNETNPVFKFPDCWHQNTDSSSVKTILLDVQEVKPIAPGVESVLIVDWKKLSKIWDEYNPDGTLRTYLLAHIAPFDGLDSELSLTNAVQNKNLSFREITASHYSIKAKATLGSTVSIMNDANTYNLLASNHVTNNKFSFDSYNIPSSLLDTLEFKFSLYNRLTNALEQEILFKKTNGVWSTNSNGSWLNVNIDITDSHLYGTSYKNAILNYEFNFDNNNKEIKFNVKNV